MGFKIEGWDDIQRFLDDYQKGFDPQTFDDWARCVAEIAKTMCDDLLVSLSNRSSSSRRILEILALTLN
jgi:hypothetical protein